MTNAYALSPEELLHVLHDAAGATISVIDRDWRFRYVNVGFARAVKMPAEEVVGRLVRDLYGDGTVELITPNVNKALAGETVTYERLGRIHEDDSVWITVTISPWRALDGEIKGFITSTLRVHELRVANQRLQTATERLALHVENSPLTVLELNAALTIERCSPRAATMLGYAPSALLNRPLSDLFDGWAATQSVTDALARLQARTESSNQVEAPFRRGDGTEAQLIWFNSALETPPNDSAAAGQGLSLVCLIEDVTTKRQAEQQLRHMATHDALTGLANRRGLTEGLARMLERAARDGQDLACLYLDLDGFKEVNDRHGHAVGDVLLSEVAARFSATVRPQDLVARVGGDEFVIVIHEAEQGSADLSRRLLQAVQRHSR